MQKLPQEILDAIAMYLPYRKAISISPFMKGKLEVHHNETAASLWDIYIEQGNLIAVKWMYLHHPLCKGALDFAAECGHLGIVKFLHTTRAEASTDAMNSASENGHLDVVKWLHENRSEGCTKGAMDWAGNTGHLEVIKWLHDNRSEGCTKGAMDSAAGNGHLEVVKWLHENTAEGLLQRPFLTQQR